jgi:hypothetical protein
VLKDLRPGHVIEGPAVLIDDISTVVVEPHCSAHITAGQDIRIQVAHSDTAPFVPITQEGYNHCPRASIPLNSSLPGNSGGSGSRGSKEIPHRV